MALIDQVAAVCSRLAPGGWGSVLRRHGLDIEHSDLGTELSRQLTGIDRSAPGFEDFAADGLRGVEPGDVARSLLYHALASPGVVSDDGRPLSAFPTLAELDVVENFVFAARRWSFPDVVARAGDALVAVAVFAHQYRRAPGTAHGSHADLCLARTGLAEWGRPRLATTPKSEAFSPLPTILMRSGSYRPSSPPTSPSSVRAARRSWVLGRFQAMSSARSGFRCTSSLPGRSACSATT